MGRPSSRHLTCSGGSGFLKLMIFTASFEAAVYIYIYIYVYRLAVLHGGRMQNSYSYLHTVRNDTRFARLKILLTSGGEEREVGRVDGCPVDSAHQSFCITHMPGPMPPVRRFDV